MHLRITALFLIIILSIPQHAVASDSLPEHILKQQNAKILEVRSSVFLDESAPTSLDVKIKAARSKAESGASAERAALKAARKAEGAGFATSTKSKSLQKLRAYNDTLKRNLDSELTKLTSEERSHIQQVEPNYLYTEDAYLPNDVDVTTQWALRAVNAQQQTIFDTTPTLTRKVIVAVIDSGIDYMHEDLNGSMWSSATCVDSVGAPIVAGCTNGYDFLSNDADPYPTEGNGHGTAVASLIAAQTDNGKGIASLSQNRARIMSLRVSDGNGASLDAIVPAIYFAVNNGADIINMSLSGPTYSQTMANAITFAESRGVTIVAAAGNYGSSNDVTPMYPASYTNTNVIAVAATDKDAKLAAFSNYGSSVDVSAPGVGIRAAQPGNAYASLNGTSFAAPIISSYIARGISEGKTPIQIISSIPNKVLGSYVGAAGAALPASAFVRMPDGRLFNTTAKGGEYVDGYTLDCTVNCIGDSTLGLASQISPGTTDFNNPTAVTTLTPVLTWSSVAGAGSYGVYLTDVTTGATVLGLTQDVRAVSLGTAFTTPTLIAGHVYRWNTAVRKTTTASTKENLTPVWYFRPQSGSTPPPTTPLTAPTSMSPGSSAAPGPVLSNTVTASWSSVAPTATAPVTQYNIAWRDLSQATPQEAYTNTTSYSITGLIPGRSYRMDVAACNALGCGPRSSNFYFTVSSGTNVPPTVPVITGSSNSEVNKLFVLSFQTNDDTDPLRLDVRWFTTADPNYYEPWGGMHPNFPATLAHTYSTPGSYCVTARAYDGQYTTAWSPCYNVTIGAGSPDLILNSINPGVSITTPGSSNTATVVVKNNGVVAAGASTVALYISPNAAGNTLNTKVGEASVPVLAAGATASVSVSYTLPVASATSWSGSGLYRLVAQVDSQNVVNEGVNGEQNNVNQYAQITVNLPSDSGAFIGVTPSTATAQVSNEISVTFNTSGIPSNTTMFLTSPGLVSPSSFTTSGASTNIKIKFSNVGTFPITVSGPNISNTLGSYVITASNIQLPTSYKATITLTDTSSSKSPLAFVPLRFVCVSRDSYFCSNPEITATTDSVGRATITTPDASSYVYKVFGTLSFGGEREIAVINVNSNTTQTIPLSTNYDVTHDPIILVPGIMGSTMKSWSGVVPYLDGGKVNASDLEIADAAGTAAIGAKTALDQVSYTRALGWEMIRKDLEAKGYTRGKTIIDCPYDWRLSDEQSANEYLRNCIDNALTLNPGKKVSIIAHSQGGLVTRALLQKPPAAGERDYATVVSKLVFLGTPMKGAAEAYLSWSGGEAKLPRNLILAKTLERAGVTIRIPNSVGALQYLLNGATCLASSLAKGADATFNPVPGGTGIDLATQYQLLNDIDSVSILDQKLKSQTAGTSYVYTKCGAVPLTYNTIQGVLGISNASAAINNNYITRAFIRANAPSVKQLLPTYEFLKVNPTANPTQMTTGQNEFSLALDSKSCSDGNCNDQDTTRNGGTYNFRPWSVVLNSVGASNVFFGYGNEPASTNQFAPTITNIIYQPTTKPGLWEDGMPVEPSGRSPGTGDGTVPSISITNFINNSGISSANINAYYGQDSDHAHLMRASLGQVIPFLTGLPYTAQSFGLSAADSPDAARLNIRTLGSSSVKLTQGASVAGIDASGAGVNTFTGADVNVTATNSSFSLSSPLDGTYQLSLSGPINSTVILNVDYVGTGHSEPHEFILVHKAGASESLNFTLNQIANASSSVFTFTQAATAPSNVRVTKSGANSAVSWSAPVGQTVQYYTIYMRAPGEQQLTALASTTATSFTTSIPFGAASTTLIKEFSVAATVGGTESFLTIGVQNNDTDADGVSDAIEAEIGSNPNIIDTDGDGLTDGQEYFVYQTDATKVDTDNDGESDYTYVIRLLTANRPPTVQDDAATVQTGIQATVPVLANDYDIDGSLATSTLVVAAQPAYGAAVVQGANIKYTSQLGFVGTDSFTYSISDNKYGTSTATVRVTVTQGGNVSYTSKSMSFTTLAGDGRVYNDENSGKTWAQVISDPGTGPRIGTTAGGTTMHVGQSQGNTGASYYLARLILPFDTSALPDSAVITGATLTLKQVALYTPASYSPQLVQAWPASLTSLTNSDFPKKGSVRLNSSFGVSNASSTVSVPFNTTSLATISATSSSSFALISYSDLNAVAPTTTAFVGGEYYMSENGASTAPTLTVFYDEAATSSLDTTAPTVTLLTQAPTSTIAGVWTLTATATDAVWVKELGFAVDGKMLASITGTAFSYPFDTRTLDDGAHTLAAYALDSSGNRATSSIIAFTSANLLVKALNIQYVIPQTGPEITFTTTKPALSRVRFGSSALGSLITTGTRPTTTAAYSVQYLMDGFATSTLKLRGTPAGAKSLTVNGAGGRIIPSVSGRSVDTDSAFQLSQTGDVVGAEQLDSTQVANTLGQSISFWIKTTSATGVGLFARATTSAGTTTELYLDQGRIRFGNAQSPQYHVYTPFIADGAWHKVDLVITSSPLMTLQPYVDAIAGVAYTPQFRIAYPTNPFTTLDFVSNTLTAQLDFAVDELSFTAGTLDSVQVRTRFDAERLDFGLTQNSYASSTLLTTVATTTHRIQLPLYTSDLYFLQIDTFTTSDGTTTSAHIPVRGTGLGIVFTYSTSSLPTDGSIRSTPFEYGVGDWNTERNNNVGVVEEPEPGLLNVALGVYQGAPSAFMSRVYLAFDTSAIPTNATVLGANISLTPKYIANEHGGDPKSYFAFFPSTHAATSTLQPNDWTRCGPSLNGAMSASNIFKAGWVSANVATSVPLTAYGLANINRGGYTTLCIREGHDVENVFPDLQYRTEPPPWSGNAIQPYGAELGVTTAPKLTLTYTFGSVRTPPTITLATSSNITLPQYSEFMHGVTAYDVEDGNLNTKIKVYGTVDPATPGIYRISYEVVDSDGMRTTLDRAVTITPSTSVAYTAQFKFDGALGTSTKNFDFVANAVRAAAVNTVASLPGRDGTTDGSYALAGEGSSSADSRLEIATTSFSPGANSFSLSVWVRTSATAGGSILAATQLGTRGFLNFAMNDAGQPNIGLAWPGYEIGATSPYPINDNKWHKLDATFAQGAQPVATLYVDGVWRAAATGTASFVTNYATPLYVAQSKNWSSLAFDSFRAFKGRVDEVGITMSALYNSQILARFQQESFGLALSALNDYDLAGTIDLRALYVRAAASSTPSISVGTSTATSATPIFLPQPSPNTQTPVNSGSDVQ